MESFTTLAGMVQHVLNSYHNAYAFNYRHQSKWQQMSTEQFVETIGRLALGLRKLGLKKGDTVGLLARPSPYWLIVDLATIVAGGISVPLFAHVSEENFLYEVKDASMKYLFVLGHDQWGSVCQHHKLFANVVTHNVELKQEADNVLAFEDVLNMGDELSQEDPALYSEMRDEVLPEDIATIIYTSGSTGTPKGVELTHSNLVSQVLASNERFPTTPQEHRVVSMLPLAHVFERMLVYHHLSSGISIYFVDDLRRILDTCKEAKPTHCAMVPLIVEKMYARIKSKIEALPPLMRSIGQWALRLADKPAEGLFNRCCYLIADLLVYRRLRKAFGGHLQAVIVGGAPLQASLCRFFLNIGIPLYQGYGLTETSPVLTANYPDHNKPGTVGKAFPGVELKISSEGEILARGPNVMHGYHNDALSTHVVLDDENWLHTGDLGSIDDHGFVTVTGRIKEILKTSGGKMVSPVPIELALCEPPIIDMALVIADSRKYVTCLLFPDFDELGKLKKKNSLTHLSHEDFVDSPLMKKTTKAIVDNVNANLNDWEKIRAYRYVTTPITMESGDLTATMKIRRHLVTKKMTPLIDTMY